jgi:hypothetical protein
VSETAVRTALLRELPSPWRKDPLAEPAIRITGPVGTVVTLVDQVLTIHAELALAPYVRWNEPLGWNRSIWAPNADAIRSGEIPLVGQSLDELRIQIGNAGAGATLIGLGARSTHVLLDQPDQASVGPDTPVTLYAFTSHTWWFLSPMAAALDAAQTNVDVGLAQLDLLTAAGVFADRWGAYCGIPRRADEADADYTARIRHELLRPRENNLALADLLETDFPPLTVTSVTDLITECLEPSDDRALRGRPLRGWVYNIATIEIVCDGLPTAAVVAAAERNVAAGVRVYIRGQWAVPTMPSPAGYDFAGSQILLGVPAYMTINAPPEIAVGAIAPPGGGTP